MKKLFIPIVFLNSLLILSFANPNIVLTNNEALHIGVDKYLKFLWMVDGAFNSERLKEDFIVNGEKIKEDSKLFTCKYKKSNSKECIGNNFEKEFNKLFSKNISYQKVYTDEAIYSWILYKDEKYIFKNLNNCSTNRMGLNHSIKVIDNNKDKIIYEVMFENKASHLINKKDFTLIKEDNDWKISTAFYYDLCGMHYTIY